jgi:hypothetical protein
MGSGTLGFSAFFSDDDITIGKTAYKYAQLTAEFLNYNAVEFIRMADEMLAARGAGAGELYAGLARRLADMLSAMPLFGGLERTAAPGTREFADEVTALKDDLAFISTRYRWLLKRLFASPARSKPRGGGRYARLLDSHSAGALLSGTSLGKKDGADPAAARIQFTLRQTASGELRVCERMDFSGLADFIYIDLFRGIMRGYIPKPCKLCGAFFLQGAGFFYEYCEGCRSEGPLESFRLKVRDNEVWKLHQRAYKKYYARLLKGRLTREDFDAWALRAAALRDKLLHGPQPPPPEALEKYAVELNNLAANV